jgi:hypothetical protein
LNKQVNHKLASILLVFFIATCFSMSLVNGQIDQGNPKIQEANDVINRAFIAVLDAEQAGSNVTNLLTQLNGAAELLSGAEIAYSQGDISNSTSSAVSVIIIAGQVMVQAAKNKEAALALGQETLIINIAQTVMATAILIFVLAVIWLWLKKRYVKGMMHAKPEVVTDET